jgi:CubicO group peptidase (beta-lactamase class C family)
MRAYLLCLAAVTLHATPAFATGDEALRTALEKRFKDDRTGACVTAAVIENGATARAYYCANPKSQRPYDEHTAFEIGSVTKTMTAALLAEFIGRGEIALGDPIAQLLPPATAVPAFNDRQITIANIVTHTSGLPSFPPQWRVADASNPYAAITERDLLGTLAATRLTRTPGSQWEYSNFAMMVLSYGLAKRSGKDFETLLRERLLGPLGMDDTFIAKRPSHVHVAQGHLSTGAPAGPWDLPVNMAGVGGARATLPDMVRYLEGELGIRESAITPALQRTQQQVAKVDGHAKAMNWMIVPSTEHHELFTHEGATGGYSSFVGFDREAKRGAILLSDTSLVSLGGLGILGRHLLDPSVLLGSPRIAAAADPKLIDALVGRYRLKSGLGADLRRKGDVLTIQADGQPEFEMGYDSAGDFYPLAFDALMRPKRKADGTYTLTWFQGGGALDAERISMPPAPSKWTPTKAQLDEYEGDYPLAPAFGLHVSATDAKLIIQGTGQRQIEVAAVEKDTFVAESVGAEITFERDSSGKVIALVLKQRGQTLRGERH